jgi:hypothetical protein
MSNTIDTRTGPTGCRGLGAALGTTAALLLSACATTGSSSGLSALNQSLAAQSKTTEAYYIVDLKTALSDDVLFDAIERGSKRNTNGVSVSRPLVMGAAPDTPGRFTLVNRLDAFAGMGSGLAQLLGRMGGAQLQQQMNAADCTGAKLVAVAQRSTGTQEMSMYTCAYPYTDGYSLQVYTNSTAKRSGGMKGLIEKGVMGAIGSEEAWAQKTVANMIAAVAAAGPVDVTLTESSGPLPNFDADGRLVAATG